MKIDLENRALTVEGKTFEIPETVIEALQDEPDFNDSHLIEASKFLDDLDLERLGLNGFRINNYYEFIFKVDGERFLDPHVGSHEVSINIDNVDVRIGSPSDFAVLVIYCRNPFMKSLYTDGGAYHYISISFSCKESIAGAVLQYSKFITNKTLSKGNSFIVPDDVFKSDQNPDEREDYLDQPSLADLISDLKNIEGAEYKTNNRSKLFHLIAQAYNFKEDERFISYFQVLECLGRNQAIRNGESKISKYLRGMDEEFKAKVIKEVDNDLEYDKAVECMRVIRNTIVHPMINIPRNTALYPIKKIVRFQKVIISTLLEIEL